ncbi:DUF4166 domain-containing protein [Priestia abyssalis]|uniref:DUF4166 domain-containing protein n=1 Tax=Priestia abyssalis TaxID=1221450 RepID=UPI0009951D47|nr:DUF4166 domain-containing protein [Priestia abyssalis]
MSSIYRTILGDSYEKLHPKLQQRYDITEQRDFHGVGKMDEITGGSLWIRPFFRLGTKRRLFFPERGKDIPFTIYNEASVNEEGKTLVKWNRTFVFGEKRRFFDAVMSLNEQQDEIIDYFGEPPLLVSTLSFHVDDQGGMNISSKKQWLYIFGKNIPLPRSLYGKAMIMESFDDEQNCFRIKVEVRNPLAGALFSYNGTFTEMERDSI